MAQEIVVSVKRAEQFWSFVPNVAINDNKL